MFTICYEPGELKAIAYHNDGRVTESTLRSAEGDLRLVITPETEPQIGNVLFADISVCGANGQVESHADEKLRVSVSGGKLLAFGSARPNTEEVFHSGEYSTYYGHSLAAIMVTDEDLTISVNGTGKTSIWKKEI